VTSLPDLSLVNSPDGVPQLSFMRLDKCRNYEGTQT
jgi:hypothetical protein